MEQGITEKKIIEAPMELNKKIDHPQNSILTANNTWNSI